MTLDSYQRIRDAVAKKLDSFALPTGSATILLCVSGGADSTCLLRVLQERQTPIAVFHLDHRTRGDASARDADFVKALTLAMHLPFHLVVRDIPAEAAAKGLSIEEAGRIARYEEASHIARSHEYAAIATAHQAGDQAETVLMRIIRGTGLHGIAGIPAIRNGEIPIIRPLIECTRAEILAALQAIGQDFQHDASNDSLDPLRNRIRHELLPLLREQYNPAIDDALVRLARTARDDDDYLDQAARAFSSHCAPDPNSIRRDWFRSAHPAMQRRAVGILLSEQHIEPDFNRIETLRALISDGATGAACDLEGVLFYNNRTITEASREIAPALPPMPLTIPGETRIHDRLYRVRYRAPDAIGDPRAYCSPKRQVFDADAFMGNATIRGRHEGDRFQPLGMEGEKKLKDWFIDRGLTRRQRAEQQLVTVDDRILWVVGHTIDARAAITAHTRRVVEIEVSE